MRISFNWLRQYINIKESAEELSAILTGLGLEVESIEKTGVDPAHLNGVIVAEVVECSKHPNADRLSITKVSIGSGDLLQVVCGAPNVATGQKVLLATIGTTLHPRNKEAFEIKKGKIRGEVSEGMLCAEDELGISDDHAGLLILPAETPVGKAASDIIKMEHDIIFEIGLTPNRADAMSHLGVAKDLLAWYRLHKEKNKSLVELPLADLNQTSKHNFKIHAKIADNDLCPRYSGICLSGIKVQESPDWLKSRIRSMGLNPINNIVDITNYIMYEMGQPLHAFDYNKINKSGIHVKTLPQGTPFISLDGIERKLNSNDLMICDGNDKPMCIAGVFGGMDSGVSETTTNIFIESAHFKASSVRRSSMTHNLRTQSAKCFEKGTDPSNTILALQRAVNLIQQTCPAEIASEIIDVYPKQIFPAEIKLDLEKVASLSGIHLDKEQLKTALFALDMEVQDLQNGSLQVFVPTNKPDVTRWADIVEEVCRVYGFDKIQMPEKISISFPKQIKSSYQLREQIAGWLTANGLHEIMSLSLVRSVDCIQSGIWQESELVYIHNTSNIQYDVMRPGICLGALDALQFNVNRQQTDLAFYEMAKEYHRNDGGIIEKNKLGIALYGMQQKAHWLNPKPQPQDLFSLKTYVSGIFQLLKIENETLQAIQNNPLFEHGIEYIFEKQIAVRAGKLSTKLCSIYDIKKELWFAEFDLDVLMNLIPNKLKAFSDFSKFPQIKRDLALVIDQKVTFSSIEKIANHKSGDLLKYIQLFDVYENAEHLGAGKKSYAVSFTFEKLDRQMRPEEIETLMNDLINAYESELGAVVRK